MPKELIQDVEPEPASFQEASRSEHASIWNKAMSAEFEGLLGAGTFELAAKTPTDCNVIDARWVYKWKADETGKIVKAKARLVAKGSSRSMAWIILRLSRLLQMPHRFA